jgi:regulator of replication initiation timing
LYWFLVLAVNDQDVIKICCNNCNELRQELQETLEELKSVRLKNDILPSEINATHIAENTSTNEVHSVNGVNHDERESGTDKNRWMQVVNGHKKASGRQNYPQMGELITT